MDKLIKEFYGYRSDFMIAVWYTGSGFLAALQEITGEGITIVKTTWGYHPTAEQAVQALIEETTSLRAKQGS